MRVFRLALLITGVLATGSMSFGKSYGGGHHGGGHHGGGHHGGGHHGGGHHGGGHHGGGHHGGGHHDQYDCKWYQFKLGNRCYKKARYCYEYNGTNSRVCNNGYDNLRCDWNPYKQTCYPEYH